MKWFFNRLLWLGVLSVLIFFTSHLVIRLLPGDPVDLILAETGTTHFSREVLVQNLHLDESVLGAFRRQFTGLLRGDLGVSIHYRTPIASIILPRALHSLQLAFLALAIGVSLSFGLALLHCRESAWRPFWHQFTNLYSTFLAAAPSAWLVPLLSLLLCVKLRLFPVTGSLAVCSLVLGFTISGFWVRAFSRIMETEKRSEHYRSAQARGLPENRLLLKYALFPSLGSMAGFLGTQAGWLAAGAAITETVFDWPGLGSLLIESILKRDYPLMEMTLFFTATLIFAGTLLGDSLQILIHPRLREESLR